MTDATFTYLFNAYLDNHARIHCERWQDSERMFRRYLANVASRPAESITRFEWQQLHSSLGTSAGKTTANRVLQLVRAVYNKGIEWEIVARNPAIRIKLFRLQPRDRFLEIKEIAILWECIESLRYETTRDFLRMCLLTGARRSNVAAMKFSDINSERRLWRIERTKNGDVQIVPLVDAAMAIVERRQQCAGNDWVFPSDRSKSGHITRPEEAWRVLLERAKLSNVRIHDLRRTLASYEAMTGASIAVIAKTLGHRDLKSTMVYARLQVDAVRNAMDTAIDAMGL